MAPVFKNNATSTLATSITTGSTTITVQSGDAALFPSPTGGDWAPITVVDGSGNIEVMRCTARSGANLTVTRAQEGTTAKAFSSGARVDHRLTAGALSDILTILAAKLDASGFNAAAVLALLLTVDGTGSGLDADLLDAQSAAYYLDLANATGTIPEGGLPTRLRATGAAVNDWNTATATGFYASNRGTPENVQNTPDGAAGTDYWVGWTIQSAINANFAVQTVQALSAVGTNTKIFRRHLNSGTWGAWYRAELSQTEQDARYFQQQIISAANPNINALTNPGSYYLAATPTNGPAGVDVSYFSLAVFGGGNTRTQILSSYTTSRTFIRGGSETGGVWTWEAWREMLHSANLNGIKGLRSSTAGVTAAAADTNQAWLPFSADHTITIPAAASHPAGTVLGPFKVLDAVTVTFQRSSTDVFRVHSGLGSPTSFTMSQGQQCYLVSNGIGTWEVFYLSDTALLAEVSFSAASSLTITLPKGFRRFRLTTRAIMSAAAALVMRTSTDGGATWATGASDYSYDWLYKSNGSAVGTGWTNNSFCELMGVIGTTADQRVWNELDIYDARDATVRTFFRSRSTAYYTAANAAPVGFLTAGGARNNNEANNAIQIYPGSGTISGHYKLEGIV
ncbi:pyocin knob domain-containing protein [Phreatobacter oligotrophus]|uniref:Tail fiber protein n=1 Tax=Phreatobacter oligotrophus TaxID=1122261 RepID=A0A2T4ZIU3_9HYPH|nr:pyocin knob domain-containing protein [Phreatobacter oligotrophus]PTM61906.1 hypothetical protein C8P69_101579 [Phreatobacter oligotrophus]